MTTTLTLIDRIKDSIDQQIASGLKEQKFSLNGKDVHEMRGLMALDHWELSRWTASRGLAYVWGYEVDENNQPSSTLRTFTRK